MTDTLLVFAVVAFVGIATPGPTVLLALANGANLGVRASLPGMMGAVLADFVLISAVALGLGALLAASEFWFSAIKWIGVVYLAYLGIRLFRSSGSVTLPAESSTQAPTGRSVFLRSFLVAVTNPKGYLFFSAFLPQFISTQAPQIPQYAMLAAVFSAINLLTMFTYASAGAKAIRLLKRDGALWLDRACGGALLALAGSLALYRRNP
ncbi:LysE family translocator [Achromobacter sp.]|uniref:LysE family translocator n=1 Tax=Achromobacter sp. TaxID=134375 RepID=UPI002F941E5E